MNFGEKLFKLRKEKGLSQEEMCIRDRFYANLEGAAALCTAGGLQITPNSEVLDTEFNVIPGLYAIGNVSGSMFHGTYPHNLNCISHSRCITFGYNVAKQLASK